jgi:hypothetical protein
MANVAENLNALHKTVYGEGVPDLVPNIAKLQREFAFESAKKIGDYYEQAVRLALPGGFTHELSDGTAGVYSLNDAKAGTQKKAKVYGYQTVLRDQMSYDDAAKAAAGGAQAYKEGTSFFFEGMQRSARKRIETNLLYGQMGIGKISGYTSGDPSITISASEWAPQIWAGMEGAEIDIHNTTTSTVRGSVTISAVDVENRKITISATVSGCAANDIVYFKGAYGKELVGVHKILSNTSTLFNIDASTYSLWKSVSQTTTGALSFKLIKKAIAKAVGKGLMDDVVLYLNPGGWDDVAEDIASLRSVDKNEIRRVEIGHEEIVYVSQNGKTRLVSHPMVKEGYAYGLCKPYMKRVGASDFEMGAPGMDGEVWFHLDGKAGIEARGFTNQAIFSEMPAVNFLISGIVNTTA